MTLPKLLKKYSVDRIISYSQLPPDKESKILFGWEETTKLPPNKKLVLSVIKKGDEIENTLSCKEDYISYFNAIVGGSPEEFLEESKSPKFEKIKIDKDFSLAMAKFLVEGEEFCWKGGTMLSEFFLIEEEVDRL